MAMEAYFTTLSVGIMHLGGKMQMALVFFGKSGYIYIYIETGRCSLHLLQRLRFIKDRDFLTL